MLPRCRGSELLMDVEVGRWVGGGVFALVVGDVIEYLAGQLNVVVCELANLGIVDTKDLCFLGGAERETRNQVHDEEDEAGATERVDTPGDGISKLVAELDPVVVEPSTVDEAEAVQVRYVISGEEGSEDVADETANGVLSKNIQSIVDSEEELELGGIVGACGSDNTIDDSGPGGDITGARSDGNETGDDTRAETNSRPLALETVIKDTPGDTSDASCEVGYNGGHDSAEVGSQS